MKSEQQIRIGQLKSLVSSSTSGPMLQCAASNRHDDPESSWQLREPRSLRAPIASGRVRRGSDLWSFRPHALGQAYSSGWLLYEDPPSDREESRRGAQPCSPKEQLRRELALSRIHVRHAIGSLHQWTPDQLYPSDDCHQEQDGRQDSQDVCGLNHCKRIQEFRSCGSRGSAEAGNRRDRSPAFRLTSPSDCSDRLDRSELIEPRSSLRFGPTSKKPFYGSANMLFPWVDLPRARALKCLSVTGRSVANSGDELL